MSWLNLNQSLSSLKGQITNFASEVLSEGPAEDVTDTTLNNDSKIKELEDKCRDQEQEIAALKRLTDELEASLQAERLYRKNGVRDDESSWNWDSPSQTTSKPLDQDLENQYKVQIRDLQDELSSLKDKDRDAIDLRPNNDEELRRLKEENHNLTTNLEDLDNQHQVAMERLLSLKKELQKNFEVLKQEHEELKNANDEYVAESKNLLIKLGERDKEIESLKSKSEYETLYHKYQNLERVHSLLQENAEKFQEENQELHEEVFKLQEHITKVEHDLELSNKHSEMSNTVPRDLYQELLNELNELKSRRNPEHHPLDEVNIDDNAKSVIETLKREINDLRHQLTQKETDPHELDHKYIKNDRVMQLYNKYVNFELPVDYVGEIPSHGDNIVMYKLESVFKTVHSFKKDIDTLEHRLSEKNLTVNHLQTQIDDLTSENDFLTTDIQHFERELNEMKENNDFLISEIATLKNTSKLEPIIETHEDNLAKLETELADCNKINKTFESEIKRIEKELLGVKTEKLILQESLNDLKTKYTVMMTELELCKTQAKEVEELEHTTNSEQSKKLKKKMEEIDNLKTQLHAANTKNEQLSIDIHIIENDKVLLTKEVDDLRNTLKTKSDEHKELVVSKITLDRKLEDLENRLDEAIKHKNEIEDAKLQLEEKVATLTEQQTSVVDNSTLRETIDSLKLEVSRLKQLNEQFMNENVVLKNESVIYNQTSNMLQGTLNELKSKSAQEEFLNQEILAMKEENHKLIEKSTRLENELTTTDSKILHLENEFERLITDLNDKDVIIDNLNYTVTKKDETLQSLSHSVTEFEKNISAKNKEIEDLKKSLSDLEIKLSESQATEELHRLRKETQDSSKQLYMMNDELVNKNEEISNLTLRLEELRSISTNHAAILDAKEKEIKELNQTIVELTDKLKTTENMHIQNDEYAKVFNEKEAIERELSDLKSSFIARDNEVTEFRYKYEQLEKTCLEYKSAIDNATAEKSELINLVNLKHNESLQYHNEIQRLNHVILEQTNEFKRIQEEEKNNASEQCSRCENIKITLKEKDEIIMNLTQSGGDYERIKAELGNANDNIRALTEKCDTLEQTVNAHLENIKKLTTENAQLSEKEQNSVRELERLRHHLVEMEENYTQELMTSEQKLTECQTRLHTVEERAKQNSTVYTSNSIRANQEVETLRNQIKLLEKQREDVQAKLSEAEDARSKSEAALTNLQVVLEQFQLDKERDIHSTTEKIRSKIDDLTRENQNLLEDIAKLNCKLEESIAGLQAASRLGDQVETKTAQINDLKEQVKTLQTSLTAAEDRYYNAISNQQDKVDKNLVKNLVINYVITSAASSHNKTQVLRILSTVLDFNQQECEKLGLARSANATDSLAAEFVKFLQNESRPRAPLPNMMGLAQGGSRSSTPTSRKSSTIGPHPFEVGHKRNPSTGSNNLLFQNLDAVETNSQRSRESDQPRVVTHMDTGVNQPRNTESAILKHVLKDM